MPLSTRRSSTRSLPRVSVGKSGLICSHCVSENQKKSDIISPPCERQGITIPQPREANLWVQTLEIVAQPVCSLQNCEAASTSDLKVLRITCAIPEAQNVDSLAGFVDLENDPVRRALANLEEVRPKRRAGEK